MKTRFAVLIGLKRKRLTALSTHFIYAHYLSVPIQANSVIIHNRTGPRGVNHFHRAGTNIRTHINKHISKNSRSG